MIVAFFLTIFKDLLDVILSPFYSLQDVTLSPDFVASITNVRGMFATLAPIFPMVALFGVIGIIITIEVAIFGYKGIMWVIKKIPTIS